MKDLSRRDQLRVELTDAWEGSGADCTFRAWVNESAQDDTHTLQNACKEFIDIVDGKDRREVTERITGIKAGYVAPIGTFATRLHWVAKNLHRWRYGR